MTGDTVQRGLSGFLKWTMNPGMAGHSVKEGKLKIDSVTALYSDVSTVSQTNVAVP